MKVIKFCKSLLPSLTFPLFPHATCHMFATLQTAYQRERGHQSNTVIQYFNLIRQRKLKSLQFEFEKKTLHVYPKFTLKLSMNVLVEANLKK